MKKSLFLATASAFILAVAMTGLTAQERSEEALPSAARKEVIEVKVNKVRFEPSTITVNKGDRVSLKVISQDVAHGLTLSDFGLSQAIIPQKGEIIIQFTADKEGTFEYKCSKYCSARHFIGKQPKLTIVVKPAP